LSQNVLRKDKEAWWVRYRYEHYEHLGEHTEIVQAFGKEDAVVTALLAHSGIVVLNVWRAVVNEPSGKRAWPGEPGRKAAP